MGKLERVNLRNPPSTGKLERVNPNWVNSNGSTWLGKLERVNPNRVNSNGSTWLGKLERVNLRNSSSTGKLERVNPLRGTVSFQLNANVGRPLAKFLCQYLWCFSRKKELWRILRNKWFRKYRQIPLLSNFLFFWKIPKFQMLSGKVQKVRLSGSSKKSGT